jgi:hypothetical protein
MQHLLHRFLVRLNCVLDTVSCVSHQIANSKNRCDRLVVGIETLLVDSDVPRLL